MGMTRAFHAGSHDHVSHAETTDREHTAHEVPTGASEAGTMPRSSSGLGCRPFTAVAAVQIRSGVPSKRCPKCARDLPASEFYRDRKRSDGLQSTCRSCKKLYQTTPEQRRKTSERTARYRADNPVARKAQRKLGYAIRSGKMQRGFCEQCGTEKADAHHWKGYDRPLDVQWLCRSCHVTIEPRRGVAA